MMIFKTSTVNLNVYFYLPFYVFSQGQISNTLKQKWMSLEIFCFLVDIYLSGNSAYTVSWVTV